MVTLPRRSNIVQETLEDIIQQQATEIDRLRHELEREKTRCLVAINELEQTLRNKELTWKAQLNEFEVRSMKLQKVRKEKLYYEQLLSSQRSSTSNEDTPRNSLNSWNNAIKRMQLWTKRCVCWISGKTIVGQPKDERSLFSA